MATGTTSVSKREELSQILAALTDEQFDAIAPFISDLVESTKAGICLNYLSRDKFRQELYLKRLLPEPTLTDLPGVVMPDKSSSLEERIEDGNYDWWDRDILTIKDFEPKREAGPASLFLAHFGVAVENEEIEGWAKRHGYEVANNDDLLAVGAHKRYKDLQREYPIVQLGSYASVVGRRHVSCLYEVGVGRRLRLYCCDNSWRGCCRFLLRKVS